MIWNSVNFSNRKVYWSLLKVGCHGIKISISIYSLSNVRTVYYDVHKLPSSMCFLPPINVHSFTFKLMDLALTNSNRSKVIYCMFFVMNDSIIVDGSRDTDKFLVLSERLMFISRYISGCMLRYISCSIFNRYSLSRLNIFLLLNISRHW